MSTEAHGLVVALHNSIPLLSKRLSIWSRNLSESTDLQLVKDDPKLPLKGAVLVVGQGFSQPDGQLVKRLQESQAAVVRDSWLSACIAAKARVPFDKHQAAWLPLPRPAGNTAQTETAAKQQRWQIANLLESASLQQPQHDSRGQKRGVSALSSLPSPAAAGASDAPAAAAAGACALLTSRWQNEADLLPSPKRHHRDITQPAAGSDRAVALDLAAAEAAAAYASQQAGSHVVSNVTADALKTLMSYRAWVPAVLPSSSAGQQKQQQLGLQGQHCAAPQPSEELQPVPDDEQTHRALPAQQPHQLPHQQLCQQQQQQLQQQHATQQSCWLDECCIKVVSYNVLADKYIHGGAKAYCPKDLRKWSSRWPRFAAELAAYQPDILALQEVDEDLWKSHWQPFLQQHLGLEGLYHPRTYGQRSADGREGVALLYNSRRFRLLARKQVVFRELVPKHRVPGEGAFWNLVASFAEGAVMCLLQCSNSSKHFLAVGTHLWYDPRQPHVKVGQTHLLCKAVADFAAELQQQGLLQQDASSSGSGVGTGPGSGSGSGSGSGGNDQTSGIGAAVQACSNATAACSNSEHVVEQPMLQHQHQQQECVLRSLPVAICGDFNSLWKKYLADKLDSQILPSQPLVSGVFELMSTGSLPLSHSHHPAQRGFRAFGGLYTHAAAYSAHSSMGTAATPRQQPGAAHPAAAAAAAHASAMPAGVTQLSTHGLQLRSAYSAARGYEPPLTNKHPSFAGCLDYVWVSQQGFEVVGVLRMPYEQQQGSAAFRELPASAVPFGSIPDAVWPSDHLAVGAVLRLV